MISPFPAVRGTCTRVVGVDISRLLSTSGAPVRSNLDPGSGHQKRTVIHLGDRQNSLRLGQADAWRHPGFAALRNEMKGCDSDERITWRQHTDSPHVIVSRHLGR